MIIKTKKKQNSTAKANNATKFKRLNLTLAKAM